jgi:hypothetical protein
MSLDFFNISCQYPTINETTFGLCDNEDGTKAYPDFSHPETWISQVKNDTKLDIVFTAIDKCVIHDNQYPNRGRCDVMLTTNKHLYLVELKNQKPPWQSHAIGQLKSTIKFLLDNHDISKYKKKKVFACNKKKEKFVSFDNEENLKLFRETGFRIDIQANVLII